MVNYTYMETKDQIQMNYMNKEYYLQNNLSESVSCIFLSKYLLLKQLCKSYFSYTLLIYLS